MKRTQQKTNTKVPAKIKQGDKELCVSSYTITDSPIKTNNNNQFNKLPRVVRDQVEDIYDLITSDPKQAIEKLLVLKEAYPQAPVLYNHLSAAYNRGGNYKAQRELVIENYLKNPDYHFAKVNYAQLCLDNGDFEKIPEIFDHKFDLKLLYPQRNTFHITEFAGFTGVMCAYYCSIGEKGEAQLLFDSLQELTPESNMVNYAKGFLYPSLTTKLQRWVYKKRQKHANKLETQGQKEAHDYSLEAWNFAIIL